MTSVEFDLFDGLAEARHIPLEVPCKGALPALGHGGQEDRVARHLCVADLALHLAKVGVPEPLDEARDGSLGGTGTIGELGRGIEQDLIGVLEHAVGQCALAARHVFVFGADQSLDRPGLRVI